MVRGFGRGSRQMGTPTANIDTTHLKSMLGSVAPGVYFGWVPVPCSRRYAGAGVTGQAVAVEQYGSYVENAVRVCELGWIILMSSGRGVIGAGVGPATDLKPTPGVCALDG